MADPVLSVVIPAHNEEGCIEGTVRALAGKLTAEGIKHDVVVVNDHSRDSTEAILKKLTVELPGVRYVNNDGLGGFGNAVRYGLDRFNGDCVAVYMADASDRPEDLVRYYRELVSKKVDCVFGTRFHPESKIVDYPWFKLILNRVFNKGVQLLFGLNYNDVTNAFKLYGRQVIDGTRPHLSYHFNLTVEIPLKAIVRGYTYTVVPNDWINRKTGESKLKIKEMGSRYLFILFYCLIEKWLSRGDYRRRDSATQSS
jgi:dolichol-phosphate mannosyltransferase